MINRKENRDNEIKKLVSENKKEKEICEILDISRGTLVRIKKELGLSKNKKPAIEIKKSQTKDKNSNNKIEKLDLLSEIKKLMEIEKERDRDIETCKKNIAESLIEIEKVFKNEIDKIKKNIYML